MSIFDKLKQGVNDAGQKAKAAVEVNRVKAQIQAAQKQVEEKQAQIGQLVFHMFDTGSTVALTSEMKAICEEISLVQIEIKQLASKLREMHNEKECNCGKVIPLDTRFCPFCGYEFAKQPEIIDVSLVGEPFNEQVRAQAKEEASLKTEANRKET